MMRPLTYRLRPLDPGASAYALFKERNRSELDRSKCRDLCRSILDSKTPPTDAIRTLATREYYSFAVADLLTTSGSNQLLLEALQSKPVARIAPFRFAKIFGVTRDGDESTPLVATDLQSIPTIPAACALAALGIVDWTNAPPRVRAVFALRTLIAEMRS